MMKRVSGAVAIAFLTLSGCTGQSDSPQASPSESSTAAISYESEKIDLAGLCGDLVAEPLRGLADTYGFEVQFEDDGPGCYGRINFIEEDGSADTTNGISVVLQTRRYETAAEAESAFEVRSDPDSSDFSMTLASGRFTPEVVDDSGWDEFAIVVADPESANQELQALLRQGTIIVDLSVTVDVTGSSPEACRPYSGQTSCAMSTDLAEDWVRSKYADDLLEVVSGLDQ